MGSLQLRDGEAQAVDHGSEHRRIMELLYKAINKASPPTSEHAVAMNRQACEIRVEVESLLEELRKNSEAAMQKLAKDITLGVSKILPDGWVMDNIMAYPAKGIEGRGPSFLLQIETSTPLEEKDLEAVAVQLNEQIGDELDDLLKGADYSIYIKSTKEGKYYSAQTFKFKGAGQSVTPLSRRWFHSIRNILRLP